MSTIEQNSTDILNYVQNIVKSVCRSTYLEVCVYCAHLYIISDKAILYHMDLSNKVYPDAILAYHNLNDNYTAIIEDYSLINSIIDKYNTIKMDEYNNTKIYEDLNLREDKVYEEYISRKASYGASFYFMKADNCTPFIPVFSGLPILNKADNITVSLYDYNNGVILVHHSIFKKKFGIPYDMYYKILNSQFKDT